MTTKPMGRKKRYDHIKNASHYTEQQILKIISWARNPYEYDYIIDRLYIYKPHQKNTRAKDEYSILTARQYKSRLKHEVYERDLE